MYQKNIYFNALAVPYIALSALGACTLGSLLPFLPNAVLTTIVMLVCALFLALIVLTIGRTGLSFLCRSLFAQVLIFVLMTGNFILQANFKQSQQLRFEHAQQKILIRVKIIDFVKYQQSNNVKIASLKVKLSNTVFETNGQHVLKKNAILRLKCYGCNEQFKLGEIWDLLVKLKPPKGTASWGAYDFEKYTLANNIVATGYFTTNSARFIDREQSHVESVRSLLRSVLKTQFTANEVGELSELNHVSSYAKNLALLKALILGDRSGLTSEQWQLFRDTGTSHLIAISGLHVTLVFFLVVYLTRKFLSGVFKVLPIKIARALLEQGFQHISFQSFSMFIGLIFAGLYALIAGFSIPTQRAVLMLVIFCLFKMFHKRLSLFECLCTTLICLLIIEPTSTLHIGFWLSFVAVLIIVVLLKSHESFISMHFRMALVMMPLTLLVFNQASIISPLVNIVFIPLIALIVLPSALILTLLTLIAADLQVVFFVTCVDFLWRLLNELITVVWHGLEFFSKWQSLALKVLPSVNSQSIFKFCLVLVIGVLMFWRFFVAKLLLVLPLFLMFYVDQKPQLDHSEFALVNLDVGQGLAVLIETRQHFVIYDTGNVFFDSDSALQTIIPYLRQKPNKSIHTIIVSHADKDHIGGLDSLLQYSTKTTLMINDLSATKKLEEVIRINQHQQTSCYAQSWQIDGVSFNVFPQIATKRINSLNRNNSSCVLQVKSLYGAALLPGDIERFAEHYIVEKYAKKLPADVLVVAHHGSRTSSTPTFLNAVKPRYAIISTAYFSPYGHPHKTVKQRLKKYSDEVLSTAHSGSIKIIYTKDGILKREYRAMHPRFWYSEPLD